MVFAGSIVAIGISAIIFYQNFLSQEAKIYKEELRVAAYKSDFKGGLNPSKNSSKVPILVYHGVGPFYFGASKHLKTFGVEPETFEKQLQYLKSAGFTTISFQQLSNHLADSAKLPDKPVILTFDDGWKNQYLHAVPLLKKYGFTATFFIPTDSIGKRSMLNWEEIKIMHKAGMVIGSHSRSHPFLNEAKDFEELKKEIMESKKTIEDNIGVAVQDFAYPYGKYDERTVAVVKAAGYNTARGTNYGVYQNQLNLFTLKSILIFNNLDDFKKVLLL